MTIRPSATGCSYEDQVRVSAGILTPIVWLFAAGSLAAFGLANTIAILGSAALLASALAVVGTVTPAPGGDAAATVQLLYVMSGKLWSVGAMFFGL